MSTKKTPSRAAAELRSVANSPELLKVAHKAIEDVLIEWRDARLSFPLCANGLVIRESDGSPSPVIRMGPKDAMIIGLQAIAKHLEER